MSAAPAHNTAGLGGAYDILQSTLTALRQERDESVEWVRESESALALGRQMLAESEAAILEIERTLGSAPFNTAAREIAADLPAAMIEAPVLAPAPIEIVAAPETAAQEAPAPDEPAPAVDKDAPPAPEPGPSAFASAPERYAAKVRPHLDRLWAEHPQGLSVKDIAAGCGIPYPEAYSGVRFLDAAGVVDFSNRRDAASKWVLRPGEPLPTPDLTAKQEAVLAALKELAIIKGGGEEVRASYVEVADVAGIASGTVNVCISALEHKGRIKTVSRGDARTAATYRMVGSASSAAPVAQPPPLADEAPVTKASRPASAPRPVEIELTDAQRGRSGPLMRLGFFHCKWPIGDPADPDFRFCGAGRAGEKPYCADHQRMAHVQPPPRRAARAAHA